jgi:hypothetical protein
MESGVLMIPLSSHNGYAFGFRWSLLGCVLALFYITSCDLIIPPDNSIPRYNTVRGEKRRPNLNPGGAQYQGTKTTEMSRATVDQVYGASPTSSEVSAAMQPAMPAPPSIRQRGTPQARSEMPEQKTSPVATSSTQEKSIWSKMAFWNNDSPVVPEVPASQRVRPVENTVALQAASVIPVASAELKYPELNTTPPKPSVSDIDNTRQRGLAVRSELESGRLDSDAVRTQLLKDAGSEPTLLNNPPPPVTPIPAAPQPVGATSRPSSLNLPPPPVMNHAQSEAVQKIAVPRIPIMPETKTGGAFERLTQRSLDGTSIEPQQIQPYSEAPVSSRAVASARDPIHLIAPPPPPPQDVPVVSSLPDPVQSFSSTSRGEIEPIRLVPPTTSGGIAVASLGQSPVVNGDGYASDVTPSEATQQPLTLASPRILQEQNYLPSSRYADRRH